MSKKSNKNSIRARDTGRLCDFVPGRSLTKMLIVTPVLISL